MADNSINTFKQLAESNQITIPIIQRDYVQGADANAAKRDRFIIVLLNAIRDKKDRHLDFIYGGGDENDANRFLPLDGQQRLTTLFLLRWVLNLRCGRVDSLSSKGQFFSYQTRRSTELFCQKLIEEKISYPESGTISRYIKEEMNWFMDAWKNDKTISAMLDMLDAIDSMLDKEEYKDHIEEMAENVDTCITFDLLDMDDYHLTDSLYIKMNERGKQLSDFENWKASFIRMLRKNHLDKVHFESISEDPTKRAHDNIVSYFEYSIEHQWTDMLWKYSLPEWDQNDPDAAYPSIDDKFMQLFKFMHEMIFFIDNPIYEDHDVQIKDYTNSDEQQEKTFSKASNVKMLFDFLDLWSEIGDIDKFFENLFSKGGDDKIIIWSLSGTQSPNLFTECIKPGKAVTIEHRQKVLLYALSQYCIKYKSFNSDINTPDGKLLHRFVRVCNNLIQSNNQLYKRDITLGSNVRSNYMADYNVAIQTLCADKDVYNVLKPNCGITKFGDIDHEVDKITHFQSCLDFMYKWENKEMFKGCLKSVMSSMSTISVDAIDNALTAFESVPTVQKVQLLVACGFNGKENGNCHFGTRYFFGNKGKWDVIFTHEDCAVVPFSKAISELASGLSVAQVIENALNTCTTRDLLYYRLKYIDFMAARTVGIDNAYYYLTYVEGDPMRAIAMQSYSVNPLTAYHTEPFASAVMWAMNDYRSKVHFATRYSDRSAIYIREEVDNRRLAIKSYGSFWKVLTWGERPEVIDETLLNCLKEKSFICDYHEDENSIYIYTSNKIDMVQLGQSLLKSLIGYIEK